MISTDIIVVTSLTQKCLCIGFLGLLLIISPSTQPINRPASIKTMTKWTEKGHVDIRKLELEGFLFPACLIFPPKESTVRLPLRSGSIFMCSCIGDFVIKDCRSIIEDQCAGIISRDIVVQSRINWKTRSLGKHGAIVLIGR